MPEAAADLAREVVVHHMAGDILLVLRRMCCRGEMHNDRNKDTSEHGRAQRERGAVNICRVVNQRQKIRQHQRSITVTFQCTRKSLLTWSRETATHGKPNTHSDERRKEIITRLRRTCSVALVRRNGKFAEVETTVQFLKQDRTELKRTAGQHERA